MIKLNPTAVAKLLRHNYTQNTSFFIVVVFAVAVAVACKQRLFSSSLNADETQFHLCTKAD